MSKTASQRRFDKRSVALKALRISNPEMFSRVWEQYVRGWVGEVHSRARAQRIGDSDERRLRIFEVFTRAQSLAHATGAMSRVVNSLKVIEHECATAVAGLTDKRLYKFNEDCTSRIRNLNVKDRTRD